MHLTKVQVGCSHGLFVSPNIFTLYSYTALTALLLVHAFVVCVSEEASGYDGYQVVRIQLTTEPQVTEFTALQKQLKLDVWTRIGLNINMQLAVSPEQIQPVQAFMEKHKLSKGAPVDLQKLLKQANGSPSARTAPGEMTWDRYYTLDDIYAWLDGLPGKYGELVKVESIGKTVEERPIKLVTISSHSDPRSKPGVIVTSLFHAREWITGAMATYIINELTQHAETKYKPLLDKWSFYIVPVSNPDGYLFSWTKGQRLWRKNRAKITEDCVGVDLNRNFNDHWGGAGSSDNPCHEIYMGPSPCSEPECRALVEFFLAHPEITDYYSIHSYGQMWMTPWSFDHKRAFNHEETLKISRAAAQAIQKLHGTKFEYGASTDIYSALGGVSEDWAHSTAKVNYSYCLELRDQGENGFLLAWESILPTVEETWLGIQSAVRKMKAEGSASRLPLEGYYYCCLLTLILANKAVFH